MRDYTAILWICLVLIGCGQGADRSGVAADIAIHNGDDQGAAVVDAVADSAHEDVAGMDALGRDAGCSDAVACIPSWSYHDHWALPTGKRVDSTLCVSAFLPAASTASVDEFYTALGSLGVGTVRHGVQWAQIQPTSTTWSWAATDQRLATAAAHGVDVVMMLGYGTPWASKAGAAAKDAYFPPDDPSTFATFAGAAAARYGDKVRGFEIWNEPNAGYRFWKGTAKGLSGDPVAYADLFLLAASAIRAKSPSVPVAFGSLFFLPQVIIGAHDFIAQALTARPALASSIDTLSWHPYAKYPPTAPPEFDEPPLAGTLTSVAIDKTAVMLRAQLEAAGILGPRLWVTELGWPNLTPLDEDAVAAFLTRSWVLLLSEGVELLCWYTLFDYDKPAVIPWEGVFGLFRRGPDGALVRKAAADALTQLHHQLGDTFYAGTQPGRLLSVEGGPLPANVDIRHHVFATMPTHPGYLPQKNVHVIWRADGDVHGKSMQVRLRRSFGVATWIENPDGSASGLIHDGTSVALDVGGTPIFVVEVLGPP